MSREFLNRELKTEQEIVDWMNYRLHQNKGFEDAQFSSIYILAELTPEGNNWSIGPLRWSTNFSDTPVPNIILDEVRKIAAEALARFNVVTND